MGRYSPRFRLKLHRELNLKLKSIGERFDQLSEINFHNLEDGKNYPLGIVAGGVPYSVISDILIEEGRKDIPAAETRDPLSPFRKGWRDGSCLSVPGCLYLKRRTRL